MSRIAYVNGRYVPHIDAAVHIEDRGYQFADGVYEVCEVLGGRLVDEPRHMERLSRSLCELRIAEPMSLRALGFVMRETIRRNRVRDGIVYVQVTRGVAPRDHGFPAIPVEPAVVVTAKPTSPTLEATKAANGIKVITMPDNRWDRVDIKSIGLLPNCLAKQEARERGAYEAWLVDDDGYVTEGSSTNAWIVDTQGRLITRPADHGILRGITRATLMDLAKQEGIEVIERAFTPAEAKRAREAFITAASTIVMPVVQIDDTTVGNGKPGSISLMLREKFHSVAHMS